MTLTRGLEGVGRSGFLTMNTQVVDSWQPLHDHCYNQLDRVGVCWELTRSLPALVQHWRDATAVMDDRTAVHRMVRLCVDECCKMKHICDHLA